MATQYLEPGHPAANLTLHDVQHIAGALKRLNTIENAPVLSVEQRQEVSAAKAVCWATVSAVVESLVSLMDAIAGDPDLEPDDPAEDGDQDCCAAADDDPARCFGDGNPGDQSDCEEDDPSGDALDNGESGDCHGLCC